MKRTTLDHTATPENPPPQENTSLAAALLRVYWMFLGNAIAAVAWFMIFKTGWGMSLADVLYGLAMISLLAARYWDIRAYGGQTADGEPATMAHFTRYAIGLVALGAVLWLAAHGLSSLI
jgi:hypothetical protein